MLSEDQRWLLRMVGDWQMVDCLAGPEGVAYLMASWRGGSGRNVGQPDYMRGFQCGRGKIVSPWTSEPRVIVTAGQLNRYARELPEALKTELRDYQFRRNSNPHRGYHGRCTTGPCEWRRYLDEGDDRHGAVWHAIGHWETDLLDRALGFTTVVEPVGQLELFEVGA